MEGWLYKKGEKGLKKDFKKRYCVLTAGTGHIEYHETPSSKVKGSINVYSISKILPCDTSEIGSSKTAKSYVAFGLTLQTPLRTFHLLAESATERDLWLCAIWQQCDERSATLHPALQPIVTLSVSGRSSGSPTAAVSGGILLAGSGGTLTLPSSFFAPESRPVISTSVTAASPVLSPQKQAPPAGPASLAGLNVDWDAIGDSDDDDNAPLQIADIKPPMPQRGGGPSAGGGGGPPPPPRDVNARAASDPRLPPAPPQKPSFLQRLGGGGAGGPPMTRETEMRSTTTTPRDPQAASASAAARGRGGGRGGIRPPGVPPPAPPSSRGGAGGRGRVSVAASRGRGAASGRGGAAPPAVRGRGTSGGPPVRGGKGPVVTARGRGRGRGAPTGPGRGGGLARPLLESSSSEGDSDSTSDEDSSSSDDDESEEGGKKAAGCCVIQ